MGIITKIKCHFFNANSKPRIGEARLQGNASAHESSIGDYTYVAPNTLIKYTDIGKFCSIASNCIIGESDHPYKFMSTSPIFYHNGNIFGETWTDKDEIDIYKKTIIGNDVWIGAGVFIKSGVKVGDGAVIAAGAVVIGDVKPFEIVGGVPAKHIRHRFSEHTINLLLESKWWDWSKQDLKKSREYFVTDNENTIIEFLEIWKGKRD